MAAAVSLQSYFNCILPAYFFITPLGHFNMPVLYIHCSEKEIQTGRKCYFSSYFIFLKTALFYKPSRPPLLNPECATFWNYGKLVLCRWTLKKKTTTTTNLQHNDKLEILCPRLPRANFVCVCFTNERNHISRAVPQYIIHILWNKVLLILQIPWNASTKNRRAQWKYNFNRVADTVYSMYILWPCSFILKRLLY